MPVLLVDDDVNVVAGIRDLLSLESIHAAIAMDVDSAEAMIRSQFFPVILADIRLRSDEDGLRLIESVRAISPGSKVAAMTGYATPRIEEKLSELGARLLLKPFDSEFFVATIRALRGADDATIYRETAPRLRSMMARRYGLPLQDCEDIVQQSWCVALERRREVRDLGSFLAGTAMNLSRQAVHRIVREMPFEELDGDFLTYTTGDQTAIAVRSAIARLDERSRALCELIGLAQMSYEEVAARLKLPLGSIGPLYIRAKERLKRQLAN